MLEFPEQCDTSLNREEAQNIWPLSADAPGLKKNVCAVVVDLHSLAISQQIVLSLYCISIKDERHENRNGINTFICSPHGLKSNISNNEAENYYSH